MKYIGLNNLLNVIGMAVLKHDKNFELRMKELLNEKIEIEISDEDWDYILENYTEK